MISELLLIVCLTSATMSFPPTTNDTAEGVEKKNNEKRKREVGD